MELLGGEKYVSCSVVLPALCHLSLKLAVSEYDFGYVVHFKNNLSSQTGHPGKMGLDHERKK